MSDMKKGGDEASSQNIVETGAAFVALRDFGGGHQFVYARAFGSSNGIASYVTRHSALMVLAFGLACNLCGRPVSSVFAIANELRFSEDWQQPWGQSVATFGWQLGVFGHISP